MPMEYENPPKLTIQKLGRLAKWEQDGVAVLGVLREPCLNHLAHMKEHPGSDYKCPDCDGCRWVLRGWPEDAPGAMRGALLWAWPSAWKAAWEQYVRDKSFDIDAARAQWARADDYLGSRLISNILTLDACLAVMEVVEGAKAHDSLFASS